MITHETGLCRLRVSGEYQGRGEKCRPGMNIKTRYLKRPHRFKQRERETSKFYTAAFQRFHPLTRRMQRVTRF